MNRRLTYPMAAVCLLGILVAAGWRQALAAVCGVALGWALVGAWRLSRG